MESMKFFTIRTIGIRSVHRPYLIIIDVRSDVEWCPVQSIHKEGIIQVGGKVS